MVFRISSKLKEAIFLYLISFLIIYVIYIAYYNIDDINIKYIIIIFTLLILIIPLFYAIVINYKEQNFSFDFIGDKLLFTYKREKVFFNLKDVEIAVSIDYNILIIKEFLIIIRDSKYSHKYRIYLNNEEIIKLKIYLHDLNKKEIRIVNKSLDFIYSNEKLYFKVFEKNQILFLDYRSIPFKDIDSFIYYKIYTRQMAPYAQNIYNEIHIILKNGTIKKLEIDKNRCSGIDNELKVLAKHIENNIIETLYL